MPLSTSGPGCPLTRARTENADLRSTPRLLLQEPNEQFAHLLGLLLLHPMASAIEQMEADHAGAGLGLHRLDGAGCLIGATVALAADEHRRHVDGAAREGAHLGDALGIGAAPHAIAL